MFDTRQTASTAYTHSATFPTTTHISLHLIAVHRMILFLFDVYSTSHRMHSESAASRTYSNTCIGPQRLFDGAPQMYFHTQTHTPARSISLWNFRLHDAKENSNNEISDFTKPIEIHAMAVLVAAAIALLRRCESALAFHQFVLNVRRSSLIMSKTSAWICLTSRGNLLCEFAFSN